MRSPKSLSMIPLLRTLIYWDFQWICVFFWFSPHFFRLCGISPRTPACDVMQKTLCIYNTGRNKERTHSGIILDSKKTF
jgi:hypothetical protein